MDEKLPDNYNKYSNIAYGSDKQQVLDIYTTGKPVPTIVYYHGGAWIQGSKNDSIIINKVLKPFFKKGWNIINVEYRIGPSTAPQAAEDALTVMDWISINSDKYKINIENIITMGHSSGGHLALLAGLHSSKINKINVSAIINYLGITNIKQTDIFLSETMPEQNYVRYWVGNKESIDEISINYSPIYFISNNSPAVISIHGKNDQVVPYDQALELHSALDEKKINNFLLTVDYDSHGYLEYKIQNKVESIIFEFLLKLMKY
tara:strand:+ start:152 stop:937 length:786 start_codon:yes stop_codon:yes gene_type:complete